jgi:hypothetical protein
MDKRLAGLLGATAALTAVCGAQAATTAQSNGAAPAANYRELLDPVPNALAALMADEAQAKRPARGETQLAYHHHHHGWWRRRYHHHHHHHHHWWRRYHHHHHHHDY